MKIIFAPAKEIKLTNELPKSSTDSPTTQTIIQTLKSQTAAEIKSLYKISDKQVDQVKKYNQSLDDSSGYQALDMYNGLAYRQISVETEAQNTYLNNHLSILSALYGPIRPNTIIRPYRLDFNTPLKINGKNLRKLWGESFNDCFEKGETILNLSSHEFSSMLDQSRYNWIDVTFYEYDPSKTNGLKKHATISKKGRGQMVNFLAQQQMTDLKDIRYFDYNQYQYVDELSSEHKYVFVQK